MEYKSNLVFRYCKGKYVKWLQYLNKFWSRKTSFHFKYDDILKYVQSEPFNPIRNERELPSAVTRMAKENPGLVTTVPVAENVPDLTSKGDISLVQKYLVDEFGDF